MSDSNETDIKCSLDHLVYFLGGNIAPVLQGRLLGREPLTPQECRDTHFMCVLTVLAQCDFLQDDYGTGSFETVVRRVRWLARQPISRLTVTLRPISLASAVPDPEDISFTVISER
jgi:hypothetical protein